MIQLAPAYQEVPQLPPHITLLAFNLRLTRAERDAIRSAETADPDVSDVMFLMKQASFIDLTRPETTGAIQLLVLKGLLSEERGAEILNKPVKTIELPR